MTAILRCGVETASALAEIEQACFSDPWRKESLISLLENPACQAYAAVIEGVFAGYGLLQTAADEGELLRFAVLPAFRRQGIGLMLLGAILANAKANTKAAVIYLEVRAGNKAAAALYRKAGFTPCGLRPGYYQNPEDDALLMRFTLEKERLC